MEDALESTIKRPSTPSAEVRTDRRDARSGIDPGKFIKHAGRNLRDHATLHEAGFVAEMIDVKSLLEFDQ